jgi:hypothetical protein
MGGRVRGPYRAPQVQPAVGGRSGSSRRRRGPGEDAGVRRAAPAPAGKKSCLNPRRRDGGLGQGEHSGEQLWAGPIEAQLPRQRLLCSINFATENSSAFFLKKKNFQPSLK